MKKDVKSYACIIGGVILLSAGMNIFYIPNDLVAGGVSGLGIIILSLSQRLFGAAVPVSATNIILNIPLFLAAYWRFGAKYIKRSVFAALAFSAALRLTEGLPPFSGDMMLSAVFGGILSGTGVGLVFNGAATTGGTETAAHLLHSLYDGFSVSDYVLIIDSAVIAAGFAVFGAEKTLYAVISVFAASRCIAALTAGTSENKAALVVTKKRESMKKSIEGLDLPVLKSFYPESDEYGRFVFCIFSQKEIEQFRETVRSADKDAFIILFDIKETFGEGFKKL